MKEKVLIIIIIALCVLVAIVFVSNKKAETKRQEMIASQSLSGQDAAAIIAAWLGYKTVQEEQEFRWRDLFMGQAAVSEGVGNIFLGMGNITSMGGGGQ